MAEPKASFTQMFLMAVKLSIGAGALALPATLHACGVVEAIVLFLCMGGAVRWCMHAMLRAKDYCASRGVRVDAYPDLGSELIGGEVGKRGMSPSESWMRMQLPSSHVMPTGAAAADGSSTTLTYDDRPVSRSPRRVRSDPDRHVGAMNGVEFFLHLLHIEL